jgi:hypothetical protein
VDISHGRLEESLEASPRNKEGVLKPDIYDPTLNPLPSQPS